MSRAWVAAGLAGILVTAGACTASPSQESRSNSSTPQRDSTSAERMFGVAPKSDPSVEYQRDVVIVGGGASSVISQSNSGLSVLLKADAPHVTDIKPGRVVFVTGRIVGRVVGTKSASGALEVYMTPVELTDVIKDAVIKSDMPFDLATSLVHEGQNFDSVPGSSSSAQDDPALPQAGAREETTDRSGGAPVDQSRPYEPAHLAADRTAPSVPPIPAVATAAIPAVQAFPGSVASVAGYAVTPVASGGVGVRLAYDTAGTKIAATLLFKLSAPKVHAEITISNSRITYATLLLSGSAGFHMDFAAGSELGLESNTKSQVSVPLDFSIPLGGPVPLALTWRHEFILKTAFSARNANLSASADYAFAGGLGFTYRPGNFTVDTPGKVNATVNAVDTVAGVSVGVNGLVLAYQAKVIIGIGAFGFASGLEVGLNVSWGITNGSSIGIIQCRQVTFTMTATVGIGWAIPRLLAAVINTFLGIFGAKIPSSGGVRSAPTSIAQRSEWTPSNSTCALGPR